MASQPFNRPPATVLRFKSQRIILPRMPKVLGRKRRKRRR